MRVLLELLLFPVTGPLRGLQFITGQIRAELEAQMLNEGRVEGELMELSLQHDLGEISGPEYEERETALLEELDAIRAYKEALLEQELDAEYYDAEYYEEEEEP